LEECIHRWAGFLDQLEQLEKILDSCEEEIQRLSEPKPTIEKQAKQLERITVTSKGKKFKKDFLVFVKKFYYESGADEFLTKFNKNGPAV